MPWLVSPHDEASTSDWMRHVVVANQSVWVAVDGERLLGFAALEKKWLEHLYVDPEMQGGGVGRMLLQAVKDARPQGLWLHVFTRNFRARRFYEAAGFVLAKESDGNRNEEQEPDCTYWWKPEAAGNHPSIR